MSEMMGHVARALQNVNLRLENKPPISDRDWETLKRIPSLWKRLEASSCAAIQELGEPTAEMLKGGMEVLEASQKMGEPLEAQVGRVWWEMICIAQPAPGSTQEDQDRWDKIFAEAVAEVRAERT